MRAGERIGDDQRRRGEVVRPHVGIDAALEVAVAGEHGGGDEVVVVDRFGDLRRQRAGVADAGGAAEADEVEAELVEIVLQAGLRRDSRRRPASRARARSSPTASREALRDRVAGEQAGGDHHARVGRVGAARDGGDDDVAMADVEVACPRPCTRLPSSAAGFLNSLSSAFGEARLGVRSAATRSCGRFGPGERGLDGGEVELQRVGEDRVRRGAGAEHALRLGVFLDQRDRARRRGRSRAGSRASRRRPGRSRRWRRIPAPCWRSWRGRRAACGRGRGRRTRRTCRPRPSCAASA